MILSPPFKKCNKSLGDMSSIPPPSDAHASSYFSVQNLISNMIAMRLNSERIGVNNLILILRWHNLRDIVPLPQIIICQNDWSLHRLSPRNMNFEYVLDELGSGQTIGWTGQKKIRCSGRTDTRPRKRVHAHGTWAHTHWKRAYVQRKRVYSQGKRAHAHGKRAHAQGKLEHSKGKRAHAEENRAHSHWKGAHSHWKGARSQWKRAYAQKKLAHT